MLYINPYNPNAAVAAALRNDIEAKILIAAARAAILAVAAFSRSLRRRRIRKGAVPESASFRKWYRPLIKRSASRRRRLAPRYVYTHTYTSHAESPRGATRGFCYIHIRDERDVTHPELDTRASVWVYVYIRARVRTRTSKVNKSEGSCDTARSLLVCSFFSLFLERVVFGDAESK